MLEPFAGNGSLCRISLDAVDDASIRLSRQSSLQHPIGRHVGIGGIGWQWILFDFSAPDMNEGTVHEPAAYGSLNQIFAIRLVAPAYRYATLTCLATGASGNLSAAIQREPFDHGIGTQWYAGRRRGRKVLDESSQPLPGYLFPFCIEGGRELPTSHNEATGGSVEKRIVSGCNQPAICRATVAVHLDIDPRYAVLPFRKRRSRIIAGSHPASGINRDRIGLRNCASPATKRCNARAHA